jgi:hypothetical protein
MSYCDWFMVMWLSHNLMWKLDFDTILLFTFYLYFKATRAILFTNLLDIKFNLTSCELWLHMLNSWFFRGLVYNLFFSLKWVLLGLRGAFGRMPRELHHLPGLPLATKQPSSPQTLKILITSSPPEPRASISHKQQINQPDAIAAISHNQCITAHCCIEMPVRKFTRFG